MAKMPGYSIRNGSKKIALAALALLMVVSNACSLPIPVPWQPTETANPTAIPQATPIAATLQPTPTLQPNPAQDLPPALVETNPLPLTEIGPKTSFTFYFNQPMERGSVQDALQADPAVAGSFQWMNDATVKFIPDKPLPVNTHLDVSFSTRARAANGLALSAPVDITFQTADGFQLVDQLPKPGTTEIAPTSAVVATFTRPIVPLGADPKGLPAAFALEPGANGRGEWINTSTYIFYPDPALMGGIEYNVRLNDALSAVDGSGWAAGQKPTGWKFSTAKPKLLTILPDSTVEINLDAAFVFTFNQPMDSTSTQPNLLVFRPDGAQVSGKYSWNTAGSELTFKPDKLLERASQYQVKVSGSTQARGGASLGADLSFTYQTVPDFGLSLSEPANDGTLPMYDVFGGVRIQFTAPLAKQDLTGKFSFSPAIGDPYISNFSEKEVYISGIFAYNTAYVLTLDPGIQDKWGQNLKEPVVIKFRTQAPQPSLTLSTTLGGGTAFLTPGETAFTGQATNIHTLKIGSAVLSVNDFAHLSGIYSFERSQKYDGPRLSTFEVQKNLPKDKNVAVDIPLTQGGNPRAPGLYYYQVSSPEFNTSTGQNLPSVLLVVSRIHLVLKQSQNQLLVWAVDLGTNQPLAGASLSIMIAKQTGELTQIGSVKTNAKGLAQLDYAFAPDSYDLTYAVLGKPGDPDFSLAVTNWTQGANAWDLGIPYVVQSQTIHTYIYTDRPIYRPGQQVDFRVLVHEENNGRYSPAKLKEINVKALGEYSPLNGDRSTLYQATLPLSEYGSASGTFDIPDSVAPGYYSIQVNEDPNSILSFQVANYRKPEIELQTAFTSPELKAGQDIQATVQAKYYFGAPAANLNLQWVLYAANMPFVLPQGYQAGPLDTGWLLPYGMGLSDTSLGKFIIQGQLTTGSDGNGAIHIPVQQLLDAIDETNSYQLTLEVTINDAQELPVSNRAQALVHPADFYIGVRPDTWSGQAKNEASFTIQTYDWQRVPLGDRKLKALFQKVVFRQKADWNFQSGTPPFTKEITEVGSTDFQVDKDGQARIAFTPINPGTYQVEVSGGGALTQVLFWVGGEGRAPWPVMPSQQIRLVTDAASYSSGQTAKIFIPNPLGENTLALITVERGRVMQTDVAAIPGSSLTWELAVSEEDAPNVYISVLLVSTTPGSPPQFRIGYTNVSVPPQPLEIQVKIDPKPATAPPGGEVTLGLRITDSQGKPVQGEFSLAVVDKAVLALADPNSPVIEDAFYGQQPIGVRTSLALAVYGRPAQRVAAQAVGGRGGGGGNLSVPDVRSNFQDTAYWNGSVVTDANGTGEVKVQLPDNLTTWVVTARGLNRNVQVGEGTQELVVGKDLLIRPVTPRFLVAGDRIELAALVNNNTSKAFSADVLLDAAGLDLENPDLASQKVNLPAQGRVRVTWWATIQNVEKVDLAFSVEGGGMKDASAPTNGSLPVMNYSTPQTFATGGVLTEAGEQLEVISPPRSFNPTGGELRVELSPSLAAAILSGLKALDTFPHDYAEPVASRLLANLETYQTLQKLGISSPELKDQLDGVIRESLGRLILWQNKDGGWGWSPDANSDLYLTSYLLFTLSEAKKAGLAVEAQVIENAANYLAAGLIVQDINTKTYRLDQLVFQFYTLQQSGFGRKIPAGVYDVRERLSPWARALLAMTLQAQDANDTRVPNLVSDLESQALRSATGAHWETLDGLQFNLASPVFTTAVVSLALAQLDPASVVLIDAVRYISANRRTNGIWASTFESTWVLMALTEVMSATGELSASFAYSAVLNGMPLASGQAGGPNALTPVESRIPLANLSQDAPNGLKIIHQEGPGRLYYRAFLQVYRPVEEAAPLNRGLTIDRQMVLGGQDCTKNDCPAVESVSLSDQRELQVHLTLTLPQAMYHLVVEDFIPAGAEIANLSLNTTQKGTLPQSDQVTPLYQASDPFRTGWNWWLFGSPKIFDDHITWMGSYLPAGTYELTYRLTPLQAGEFRLLPAHAFETYFPEVEGASAGAVFKIVP